MGKSEANYPDDPNHFLVYMGTTYCSCCYFGAQPINETDDWLGIEVDDGKVVRNEPMKIAAELINKSVSWLSENWVSWVSGIPDQGANDFSSLERDSKVFWFRNDRNYFWLHPDGILGETFLWEGGIKRNAAARTVEQTKEMTGKEPFIYRSDED